MDQLSINQQALHKSSSYYDKFGILLYLNIILMLIMSFTSSGKNILYIIFAEDDYTFLSPTQYTCSYFFGPLTLLIVDQLLQRFRFNSLFYVSSFSQSLFLIGGLLVTSCQYDTGFSSSSLCNSTPIITISISSSIIAGVLSTIYYVTFMAFINSVSNDENRSFYFGFSYSINAMSTLFANIIGYFLISIGDQKFYALVLGISVGLQFLLLCVKDQRTLKQSQFTRQISQEIGYQFSSIRDQVTDHKFRKLMIYLCFAGLMNSIIYLYLPVLIINSNPGMSSEEKQQRTYIVQLFFAIGAMMGGTVAGKLSERMNIIHVMYLVLFFVAVGNSFAALAQQNHEFSLCCVASFFFGICDSSISALGLALLTSQVSRGNHVFAAYNLCQVCICVLCDEQKQKKKSLGFGFPSIWWGFFNQKDFLWNTVFIYTTTFMAFLSVYYYNLKCNRFITEDKSQTIHSDISNSFQ